MFFYSLRFLLFLPVVFVLYRILCKRNQTAVCIILLSLFSVFSFAQEAESRSEVIVDDGAWCWFSDPRAIYYEGKYEKTYIGSVSSEGNVQITEFNHRDSSKTLTVIYKNLQVDDHVNPSLLVLPDGRLMTFFTKHNGNIYYTTTVNPEDFTSFEPVDSLDVGERACYTNPVMLSEENNRIYVFHRGGYDWKPSYVYSDDLGKSWSEPAVFISKQENVKSNRPYVKVETDGISNIYFAFTDGHPRNEPYNSIYYLRYEKGCFYDAEDKLIGDTTQLPIVQELIPKVYDATVSGHRSWIWDIAVTEDKRPVVVYTTLPEETKHYYNYGIWTGTEWRLKTICRAGSAFPRFDRKKEDRDPEPHYSGGIVLDHSNPSIVYLSRPHNDVFEIEKWVTKDTGKSFDLICDKSNAKKDCVRPYVVRIVGKGNKIGIAYMYNDIYEHYTSFQTIIGYTNNISFNNLIRRNK